MKDNTEQNYEAIYRVRSTYAKLTHIEYAICLWVSAENTRI